MEEPTAPQTPDHDTEKSHPFLEKLPNSTSVLVLGILSILFSIWYFSFIGLVLSIVALVISARGMAHFRANPYLYTPSSFSTLRTGRILAFIGLTISVFFMMIMVLVIFGLLATMPFWGMIE